MEDADLFEENDCDAAAFAFNDLGSQAAEESFNVLPGNVRAGRVRKDCFQSSLMGPLHAPMVPENGTVRNLADF